MNKRLRKSFNSNPRPTLSHTQINVPGNKKWSEYSKLNDSAAAAALELSQDFANVHNFKRRPFQFLDPSLCWKSLLASTGNPPKGARGALASPGIQKYANAPKLSERNSINRKRLSKCRAPKQNEARNAYAS